MAPWLDSFDEALEYRIETAALAASGNGTTRQRQSGGASTPRGVSNVKFQGQRARRRFADVNV